MNTRQLVLFDTSVVEAAYLAPMLRGERCRDFDLVRRHGYEPAVAMHSILEITQHAKLGGERRDKRNRGKAPFPWMSEAYGYPGGLDVGRRLLSRHTSDEVVDQNLLWLFDIVEEWRGLGAEELFPLDLARPGVREALREEASWKAELAEWKFALSAFCFKIVDVIMEQVTVITDHDVIGEGRSAIDRSVTLQQELAMRSLVPNEDIALVHVALMVRAVAVVSSDEALLRQCGMTLDLNRKTAFVRRSDLHTALAEGFFARYDPPA